MLSKKFSTTLLALVVAAAIPGSVFAADITGDTTGGSSAPTSVSEAVNNDNSASTAQATTSSDAAASSEQNGEATSTQAEQTTSTTDEQQAASGTAATGSTDSSTEVTKDTTQAQGTETKGTETKADGTKADAEELGTKIENKEPVTEPTEDVKDSTSEAQPTTPEEKAPPVVSDVTEPVIIKDVAPIEEFVTDAAITTEAAVAVTDAAIVVEPVKATVTIVQRLNLGEGYDQSYSEYTQEVNDQVAGTEFDITPYIVTDEQVKFVGNSDPILLKEENTIILEYNLVEE